MCCPRSVSLDGRGFCLEVWGEEPVDVVDDLVECFDGEVLASSPDHGVAVARVFFDGQLFFLAAQLWEEDLVVELVDVVTVAVNDEDGG